MKKTDYKVCIRTQNGYPVYRVVLTDGKDFFVKDKCKICNVNHLRTSFIYR